MFHANIVQIVKSCYKIKINYRESKSCFCGVLLRYCHYDIYEKPFCHSNTAITVRQ